MKCEKKWISVLAADELVAIESKLQRRAQRAWQANQNQPLTEKI